MMSVRRVLFACFLCVLWCGPGVFVAGAEEVSERTKRMQEIVDKVVLMQYAMRSNSDSLLSYVRGAQRSISADNQQRWRMDKWKADKEVPRAEKLADDAVEGSKFVNESADAVHESVTKVLDFFKEALKNTQENAKEKPAIEKAVTWWEYALSNVSAQLTAAGNVPSHAVQAKEKMDAAASLVKEKIQWDPMPQNIRDALSTALEALSEPRKKTEELNSLANQALLTLKSAQEITSDVRLPELQKPQAPATPQAPANPQGSQNPQDFYNSQEEKLKVVEARKEELEKKTVDRLKTSGTLELKKAQGVADGEGNTAGNEAGAPRDSSLGGGLLTTSHSAALLVPFVLACTAAAMTAA